MAGYWLVAERRRSGQGRLASAGYRYRIERESLPPGADPLALLTAWTGQLRSLAGGVYQNSPFNKRGIRPTWAA